MLIELSAALALAQQCAPGVAPETLLSVVRTESRFNSLAINVNSGVRLARQPRSKAEAVRMAETLLRTGANFDLGLGQINSKNLGWLKLSIEDAFEPCANLAAAGRVLQANYATASRNSSDPQGALRVALSLYNTGDAGRGFRNGYVAKVEASAKTVVPAIAVAAPALAADQPADPAPAGAEPPTAAVRLTAEPPPPPSWDVFARQAGGERLVFGGQPQVR